jgi:hypothetical protein
VRTDLLEIAALLEQVDDPDPASVNAIHELLADGGGPLYNPTVQVSELHATLHDIGAGLARSHNDQRRRRVDSNRSSSTPTRSFRRALRRRSGVMKPNPKGMGTRLPAVAAELHYPPHR